eukprot:1161304-Pelagomonas_calceolata.AAC.4
MWSKTCGISIQSPRIVTMYGVILLGEVRRAFCGLARQSWVPHKAGGCSVKRGAVWYPFCPWRGTGRRDFEWGGGSGGPAKF